ncbi:hypothetical protein C8R45DRAFT_485143 [Mycena sanguinolenta]|nr:hypothetical protein C8R45DRAFT_485143 [Mycena sanguinolenta]
MPPSAPTTPTRKTRSHTSAGSPRRVQPPRSTSKSSPKGQVLGKEQPSPKGQVSGKQKPRLQKQKAPQTTPSGPSVASDADSIEAILEKLVQVHGIEALLVALQDQHGPAFADAQRVLIAARKSFSSVRYQDVMKAFHMNINPPDDAFRDWKDLEIPETLLPRSVIEDITDRIYEGYRTNGSPSELGNEAATADFLSGPFKVLLSLFGGILRNKPEQPIPGNDLNSGGRVEVEVLCRDAILFFLREYKWDVHRNFLDSVAQVCCELYTIHHLNRRLNQDAAEHPSLLPPVRGSLCDARSTYFIGYDGKEFSKRIVPHTRSSDTTEAHISTLLDVSQFTFAILLEGYVNVLELYHARSHLRSACVDVRVQPVLYCTLSS